MAWGQVAGVALTFLITWTGMVVAFVRLQSETTALRLAAEKDESMRDRLVVLETKFEDVVRRMEERDSRAERERLELMETINGLGARLEEKMDRISVKVFGVPL